MDGIAEISNERLRMSLEVNEITTKNYPYECRCGREVEGCDFCGSPLIPGYVLDDDVPTNKPYHAHLCHVYYTTNAGNAHRYPNQYPGWDTIKMIAQCTNIILEKLAELELVLKG